MMHDVLEKIDMSILPEEVRRELVDFYLFLVEKYGKKEKVNDELISSKLPETFYKPIKVKKYSRFNREEIYQHV